MGYASKSLGDCVQSVNSYFVMTASIISEEYIKYTLSGFNNSLCSGAPLKSYSFIEPTCNSQSNYSTLVYSISGSVPPLPGGLLTRWVNDYP